MNEIKDDATALKIAHKLVKAQEKLLIAYRVGGRPPIGAIDYLEANKNGFLEYMKSDSQ
jgi:hypothetical protein